MQEAGMNEQENSRKFLAAMQARDPVLAGEAIAGLSGEMPTARHTEVARMFFILMSMTSKHAQIAALNWVRTLPGSATVVADVLQGIDRLNKGEQL
jgi:hypothetical protein